MAGTIQCDYLQPTSTAGLTILTPSGNTIASITTTGIYSTTGSLMISANGQIVTSTYSSLTANTLQIGQSGSSSNNFTLYQPSSPDGTVRLGNGNSGSVTDLVTVNSSGNVGIGTSSPGAKLDVNGNFQLKGGGYALLLNSDNSNYYYIQNTGASGSGNPKLEFVRGGVGGVMTLDSSGNLGLGVTPSGWGSTSRAMQFQNGVSVFSNTSGLGGLGNNVYSIPGTADYYIANGYATRYYQYNGTHVWNTAASGTAGNAISFTQAMTLDASGNFYVGATSSGPGSRLVVRKDSSTIPTVEIENEASTGKFITFRTNGESEVGYVSFTIGGVSYTTSSDQRLKTNIVDAPSAINSINNIKVRSFDWIADGSHSEYGYIAQELLPIAPEAVSVPSDEEEMMGVEFGKLTPRLVKAFQEMYSELQDVKAELAALKSK